MKLFIFVLLVPFVFCDECPEFEPETCDAPNLLCGGEPDMKGCPTPQWCMHVDPYAACSARAFCPQVCPE